MVDNPFDYLINGNQYAPSTTGIDLHKEIIKQLGEKKVGPAFAGPGAWWGHAVDATGDLTQAYLSNYTKAMQEALSRNAGSAVSGTRFGQQDTNITPKTLNPSQPPAQQPTGQQPNGRMNLGSPDNPTQQPATLNPNPLTPTSFADRIKQRENPALWSGQKQSDKASWDYKQNTVGFGTKALARNEVLDRSTANNRFDAEWNSAGGLVAGFKPGLDDGTHAALQSLTFNSGTKWMNSGLGKAIQNGDIDTAKKLFLQYNYAGGKPNPELTDRRKEEVGWFGKNQADVFQQSANPTAPMRGDMPPPMGLGASQASGVGTGASSSQQPQQMAQAQQPNSFAQPAGQGQQGLPSPRLENEQELHGLVTQLSRMGMPPQQIMEVLKNYIDRSAGYKIESPTGLKTVTPNAGGGATEANHPEFAPMLPTTAGGVSTHIQPVPGGGGNLLTPGQGGGGMEAFNPMVDYGQRKEAEGSVLGNQAKAVGDEVNQAIAQGTSANTSERYLSELQALNNNPAMSRGPTHEFIVKARQFLDNVSPGYLKGTPDSEVFDKLNYYLAAENAKTLSSRVSNFSLQSAMANNPSLMHTQRGAAMLIDLMQQDLKAKKELGNMASYLPKSQWQNWNQIVQEYYNKNYPMIHEPGKPTVHLKKFGSENEMKSRVGKGEGFLTGSGAIGYNNQ